MFLPGIGGHLKVSHMDPRVSFGNESTNLSVQKSFFKIIAPYFISQTTFESTFPGFWVEDLLGETFGVMRLKSLRT